ncbi:MAG: acetyl-CoA acetyltransferase, partial [Desulfotomaculaceae bacterium]
MPKDVAIIGVGQSSFVRGYKGSIRELAFEAYREAMQDAGISNSDIGASIICSAPEYDSQRSPSGIIAEYLGLNPQPTFAIESVCSASTSGLRTGYAMVKAGLHDIVVVLG